MSEEMKADETTKKGDRKVKVTLYVAAGIGAAAVGLCFADKIDGAQAVDLLKYTAGFSMLGFGGANGIEHMAKAISSAVAKK